MKWEAVLAMVALFALGVWLVLSPSRHYGLAELREGASVLELRVGKARGVLEALQDGQGARSYRMLWRDGSASDVFGDVELARRFGTSAGSLVEGADNALFRLFAITSWGGLVWVLLGFLGQAAFFGRMALQWIVSEREKRSVVPPVFWVLSLAGGVLLFAYFAWRRDIVGILGQTTGIVIYARNLRLIAKARRREERAARDGAAT